MDNQAEPKGARTGLEILTAALVAGVAGDSLLRTRPGINMLIWSALLVALVLMLAHGRAVVSRGDDFAGAAMLLIFAAGFAWRSAPMLMFLNLFAIGVVLALVALRSPLGKLAGSGLIDFAKGGLLAAIDAAFGAIQLVFGDINWGEAVQPGWPRRMLRVGCGALLAVPALIVFGALLMGADSMFRRLIVDTFFFNLPNLAGHILTIAFLAWIVAGTLRAILLGRKITIRGAESRVYSMGATEISVALGLVDLLFFAFVCVQFRYFFGGAARVMVTPGLTYAEYARTGFFELVTVAALVLPMLLGAHWLARKETAGDRKAFAATAGVMVLLVFIIMASALERMRIYQQQYGLTELRVYTTAFMLWLAAVLAWFALTVLRGRRKRFAFGAMVTGFAAIVALNVLSPDALIARVNIQRAAQGKKFDANYTASLSADAVPAILEGLQRLPQKEKCALAARVRQNWSQGESPGWRSWNYSRRRAGKMISENSALLNDRACQ